MDAHCTCPLLYGHQKTKHVPRNGAVKPEKCVKDVHHRVEILEPITFFQNLRDFKMLTTVLLTFTLLTTL